jgi:glycosyltransferase 2 family protein
VEALLDAVDSFFGYLAAVAWGSVAVAVLCHLGKIVARTRAWRNVIAAAYPEEQVRWRTVAGAYAAAIGVNAIIPARGGDVLGLVVLKHRIDGSRYPTLAATALVLVLFDLVVGAMLLAWVWTQGVLPGLDVIPRMPPIDWLWLFQHPRAAAVVTGALVAAAFIAGVLAARHIEAFRNRVRQGFTILRSPRRYATGVAAWQVLEWALRLATVYFFLRAFHIPATAENAVFVQVAQSLSAVLPLTPAGIGTEQALLAYVLSGAASTTALLSFSVGMRLVLVTVNVVVGFTAIALMLRTLDWRSVVSREAPATQQD